jgi:carnitine O-acetyltransferase
MSMPSSPPADRLPLLDVAPLEESVSRFMNWVEPLLHAQEYEETLKSAEALKEPSGRGFKLQEDLRRELRKDPSLGKHRPFWEGWYLRFPMSLPIYINPFYFFEPQAPSGAALAARLTARSLELHRQILRGTLPPEEVKGTPQSMEQYQNLFGCTRIPGVSEDRSFRASESSHMVIFRRGRIYSLKVLDERGNYPSRAALEKVFRELWSHTEPLDFSPGIFTAANRREWGKIREDLRQFPQNRRNLEIIERALFVLVLEDSPGEGEQAFCENLFGGLPDNRWYDKSFQLIVYPEGVGGWNYDHSCRDGGSMSRVAAFLCEDLPEESPSDASLGTPELLEFAFSPELEERAREIRRENARLRQRVQLEILRFSSFGASALKKLRFSPDAFVQLALLGVQQELWGTLRSAFESVSLRHFRQGRTEGTRPLTSEAASCLRAYGEGARKESLAPLLRRAGKAHGERILLCRQGKGMDGNLGFLESYAALQGLSPEELPFFASPGWKKFNEFWMSTSATGGKSIRVAGYGPAVPEGFGVRYVKNPQETELYVTSFEGNMEAFERVFLKVGEDFMKALESSQEE